MNIMLEQMTVQKSFGHSELNDEDNLSAALKQKKDVLKIDLHRPDPGRSGR